MYQRLRNCIIHSEGKIGGSNFEEIEEYCEKKPTLSIDKNGYIILKKNFIDIAMHSIWSLFDSIIEVCRKQAKS